MARERSCADLQPRAPADREDCTGSRRAARSWRPALRDSSDAASITAVTCHCLTSLSYHLTLLLSLRGQMAIRLRTGHLSRRGGWESARPDSLGPTSGDGGNHPVCISVPRSPCTRARVPVRGVLVCVADQGRCRVRLPTRARGLLGRPLPIQRLRLGRVRTILPLLSQGTCCEQSRPSLAFGPAASLCRMPAHCPLALAFPFLPSPFEGAFFCRRSSPLAPTGTLGCSFHKHCLPLCTCDLFPQITQEARIPQRAESRAPLPLPFLGSRPVSLSLFCL